MKKPILIKITAYATLIFFCILGAAIIGLIFVMPFIFPAANLYKLIFLDIIIFIFGCFVVIVRFGIFEFFLSLLQVEASVEKIEEEVEGKKDKTVWPPQ